MADSGGGSRWWKVLWGGGRKSGGVTRMRKRVTPEKKYPPSTPAKAQLAFENTLSAGMMMIRYLVFLNTGRGGIS